MRMSSKLLTGLVLAFCAEAAHASETITYTHDVHGRLVKVVHTGTVNNGVTVVYNLDNVDNRTTVVTTGH